MITKSIVYGYQIHKHNNEFLRVLCFSFTVIILQEKGPPLPKFGEWDVNDPASAEGFTVIFNKARDEKKTGGNTESPGKTTTEPQSKPASDPGKPQSVRCSLVYTYIYKTDTYRRLLYKMHLEKQIS